MLNNKIYIKIPPHAVGVYVLQKRIVSIHV